MQDSPLNSLFIRHVLKKNKESPQKFFMYLRSKLFFVLIVTSVLPYVEPLIAARARLPPQMMKIAMHIACVGRSTVYYFVLDFKLIVVS